MANENVVSADLSGGWSCVTAPLWQWDYGQVLEITGIDDLPSSFVAHCANRWDGSSQAVLGSNGRISIPNDLLTSGEPVYVWIVLTADGTDGETKYKITIPVNRRAAPTDYPTTAQQSAITQAINALNTAAASAAAGVAAEIIDPTLEVSGKAADAAKVGSELSNLKSDIHGGQKSLTLEKGSFKFSGNAIVWQGGTIRCRTPQNTYLRLSVGDTISSSNNVVFLGSRVDENFNRLENISTEWLTSFEISTPGRYILLLQNSDATTDLTAETAMQNCVLTSTGVQNVLADMMIEEGTVYG